MQQHIVPSTTSRGNALSYPGDYDTSRPEVILRGSAFPLGESRGSVVTVRPTKEVEPWLALLSLLPRVMGPGSNPGRVGAAR